MSRSVAIPTLYFLVTCNCVISSRSPKLSRLVGIVHTTFMWSELQRVTPLETGWLPWLTKTLTSDTLNYASFQGRGYFLTPGGLVRSQAQTIISILHFILCLSLFFFSRFLLLRPTKQEEKRGEQLPATTTKLISFTFSFLSSALLILHSTFSANLILSVAV